MEQKQNVSVFRAIGNGTIYFFRNIHLVLLMLIPMAGFIVFSVFVDSGKIAADMSAGMFPPWFFWMIGISCILGSWFINLVVIHIASKPYFLNLGIKNQALTALKRLPGTLAVGIMISVSSMASMILLVIPAVILLCLWSMVLPVYILYGGIFKSFEEGRNLVRGNFLDVFLLFFIVLLIMLGVMAGIVFSGGITGANMAVNHWISALFSLLSYMIYFWYFALFREMENAKTFTHDENRKGGKAFYKVVLAFSLAGFAALMYFYIYMFTVLMPQTMAKSGIETKIEAGRTVTYKHGIIQSSVEQKDKGVIAYTYYHENGKIKREAQTRFISIVGQTKDYYENGKIKQVQNYDKGKLNGESLDYNEKGILVKKCMYRKGVLDGCEDVKAAVKKK